MPASVDYVAAAVLGVDQPEDKKGAGLCGCQQTTQRGNERRKEITG